VFDPKINLPIHSNQLSWAAKNANEVIKNNKIIPFGYALALVSSISIFCLAITSCSDFSKRVCVNSQYGIGIAVAVFLLAIYVLFGNIERHSKYLRAKVIVRSYDKTRLSFHALTNSDSSIVQSLPKETRLEIAQRLVALYNQAETA
jgi:hypothetical protein